MSVSLFYHRVTNVKFKNLCIDIFKLFYFLSLQAIKLKVLFINCITMPEKRRHFFPRKISFQKSFDFTRWWPFNVHDLHIQSVGVILNLNLKVKKKRNKNNEYESDFFITFQRFHFSVSLSHCSKGVHDFAFYWKLTNSFSFIVMMTLRLPRKMIERKDRRIKTSLIGLMSLKTNEKENR